MNWTGLKPYIFYFTCNNIGVCYVNSGLMPLMINNMGCLPNRHVHRRLYKYSLLAELYGQLLQNKREGVKLSKWSVFLCEHCLVLLFRLFLSECLR